MEVVIAGLFLAALAWSAPVPEVIGTVNVTGPGVSDHGKPNLVCFPPSLMDIAIFVFVNYLTHAASSRIPPGASTRRTLKVVIDSLCYPILGVGYALDAIAQWSVHLQKDFPWIDLPKDDLDTAHRAGALITACREHDWVPDPRDEGYERVMIESKRDSDDVTPTLYDCQVSELWEEKGGRKESKRWLRFGQPNKHFNIFGGRDLPPGYGWVFIPWGVKIEPPKTNAPIPSEPPRLFPALSRKRTDLKLRDMPLGADYSLFQPIAAVVQAISAGITLYRTRGDQLDRYGFTSFGLTVVPYLVMSVVNFFAQYALSRPLCSPATDTRFLLSFAVPKYSALYVVQSDILDEATRRLGDDVPRRCVVGRLPPASPSKESPHVKIQRGTFENGLVEIELLTSGTSDLEKSGSKNTNHKITDEGTTEAVEPEKGVDGSEDKPSLPSGKMIIPPKCEPKAASEKHHKDDPQKADPKNTNTGKPKETAQDDPHKDTINGSEETAGSPNEKKVALSINEAEDKPTPQHKLLVSRFPSVTPTSSKKPVGRKTIKLLHWAIGLSSLVIIAVISRMQLGTAAKSRWKDIFIVWLVFSCLSAAATSMVFGVSGTILKGCLWVVKKVYHFLYETFEGFVQRCLMWLRGEVKSKKERLMTKAKDMEAESRWWGYADDFIMFVLKFAFFFLLVLMVSQQLLDYGDCTYFRV